MSDQKPVPGEQDRRSIHTISPCSSKLRSPAESESQPPATLISVPFRLVADFVVKAEKARELLEEPDLWPEERDLFLTVLTTPEALNRICRLAITCDLTEDSERHFKGKFLGPDFEDIFDAILPYLPVELEEYWTKLQREDHDCFESCIDRVFDPFRSSLRRVEIIDVSTGESIPLRPNKRLGAASD